MLSLYKPLESQSLSPASSFKFSCHGGLACYNQCCRTPTVILSPYDILRLKQRLGISSGEFLRRYTRREAEERSHLPLVLLEVADSAPGCPFVSADGCTVYEDRPGACRLFPLTQGSRLTPGGREDHYFCHRLDYCRGFAGEEEWTVQSWIQAQGFGEYEAHRREWLEILLRRGHEGLMAPDFRDQDLFYLVSYDQDHFRQFIFTSALLPVYGLEGPEVERLKTDALALLQFSYAYLKIALLQEDPQLLQEALRAATAAPALFPSPNASV
ncbi:MAG: YkgJ family cysteine cluster protein [Thermodesulfobacteriota bacterium]